MTLAPAPMPAAPTPDENLRRPRRTKPRWRPGVLSVLIVVLAVIGLSVLLYPSASSWLSSYNQSKVIKSFSHELTEDTGVSQELIEARRYNDALVSGVRLDANANVPVGDGVSSNRGLNYNDMLNAPGTDVMARIQIPSIDVDLPVYHGTSDATLLRGVGHLEGSHLPIGGPGTHAVLTAHRGLAQATMFSNLDKVTVGDRFTIQVFGEVLTYEVRGTKVVDPADTDTLRAAEGSDMVTLVTCTPLGINSHRILVTGERVTPTPIEDIEAAHADPTIPGFPWWAVAFGAGLLVIAAFTVWVGYSDDKRRLARRS